jgi:16S rRNA (guanine966-N2)-methyltransferase
MRIIAGIFKGRRFFPPADNWPTRPTTDFAKEGLFNILNNLVDWPSTRMLDLFGGTGSHTYEAISRGCREVTYVDKHKPAVAFVRKTLKELDVEPLVQVMNADVSQFMAHCAVSFDYIFAGPPYGLPWLDTIPDKVFEKNVLAEHGLFVLEHNPDHDFSKHAHFSYARNYGTTIFSFFE